MRSTRAEGSCCCAAPSASSVTVARMPSRTAAAKLSLISARTCSGRCGRSTTAGVPGTAWLPAWVARRTTVPASGARSSWRLCWARNCSSLRCATWAAAEAQVAQRKLEQLRAQHKRQELRAPEAGTVVRLATHAGSQAVPGTPAVVLLPQRPLQVRAEINESFAAAVREGMRATVTLDADGAAQQQLPSARVLRIKIGRASCRERV